MDSRLELTEKQQKLVKQFANLIESMQQEQIGIVASMNGMMFNSFMFYNKSEVIESEVMTSESGYLYYEEGYSEESYNGYEADEGQIWYTPNPSDFTDVNIGVGKYYDDDVWFSVLLEKNEETYIFNRKRDMALKLAPLMEKREKLKKEKNRLKESLAEGEENLHRLEEKGLPQEIIDEERAYVEAAKIELENHNVKLKELDKEIRKVKAI